MLKKTAKLVASDAERKLGGSAEGLAPQERQSGNQIAGDKITSGTKLWHHAGYSA